MTPLGAALDTTTTRRYTPIIDPDERTKGGGASMARSVVFSIDELRADGLQQATTPHIDQLIAAGACTYAARLVVPAVTLPCHTSMFRGAAPEVTALLPIPGRPKYARSLALSTTCPPSPRSWASKRRALGWLFVMRRSDSTSMCCCRIRTNGSSWWTRWGARQYHTAAAGRGVCWIAGGDQTTLCSLGKNI